MIYTVGYQNITIEQLEQIMEEKDIGLLIDVRSIPYSRNPGKREFNKNRLRDVLGDLKYVWWGDICGGKRGPVIPTCIESLKLYAMPGEENILLLCLEGDPRECHRYYDISIRLLEHDIDAVHIFNGSEMKTSEIKGGSHEILNRDRSKKTL